MLDLVGTSKDRFSHDAVHNEMNLFSDGLYIFKVAVSLECCIRFQGHFGQAHLGPDNSVHCFQSGTPRAIFLGRLGLSVSEFPWHAVDYCKLD